MVAFICIGGEHKATTYWRELLKNRDCIRGTSKDDRIGGRSKAKTVLAGNAQATTVLAGDVQATELT
jgi:hypothetical protein